MVAEARFAERVAHVAERTRAEMSRKWFGNEAAPWQPKCELIVHPNTLRQRLRRIADLTGIDLRRDDWLMVEIAVKLVRLRSALGAAKPHT